MSVHWCISIYALWLPDTHTHIPMQPVLLPPTTTQMLYEWGQVHSPPSQWKEVQSYTQLQHPGATEDFTRLLPIKISAS